MTHEVTIGVGTDRGEFVIPSVVDGKQLSREEATRRFMAGKIKAIAGPFKTVAEAEAFSEKRSDETGPLRKIAPRRFPKGSLAGMIERKGIGGVLADDPLVKAAGRRFRKRPATTASTRRERVRR